MNTDEIVRALRSCSNHDTRKPDCDNCPLFGERLCVKKMLEGGADLIESLQAQLADEKRMADAAVEDLYEACRRSPCNNGICVKKNCTGNIIPCGFEWRRAQPENEPLTLEELRQMDGETVFVGESDFWLSGIGAVSVEDGGVFDPGDQEGYWPLDSYGEWLAYRRKPERSEG